MPSRSAQLTPLILFLGDPQATDPALVGPKAKARRRHP